MTKLVFFSCVIVAYLSIFAITTEGEAQKPEVNKLRSNQVLMRDKLKQMNLVLEGLTLDNFKQVEESADTLSMISRATTWHISQPTPRYNRLSKNFQEQAADLKRHAKEKNLEAATLDLVRMNVTCTQCHEHIRERNAGK